MTKAAISSYPDIVLFDWDGTLVDTFPLLHAAHNHVRATFDYPLWPKQEAEENIRLSARESFPKIFGQEAEKAMEIYYSYVRQNHLEKLKVFKDAENLLKTLKKHDIQTGVISNKKHDILEKEITFLGWQDYFSVVVGAGIAKTDKPTPAPLFFALDHLDTKEQHDLVWYVGDTKEDMECALAADISPVFIKHGFANEKEILSLPVTKTFEDLTEIRQFFQKIKLK